MIARAQLDARLPATRTPSMPASGRCASRPPPRTPRRATCGCARRSTCRAASPRVSETTHRPRRCPELKEGVRRLKDLQFQIQELESGLELQPDLSAAPVDAASSPPRWRPFALARASSSLVGALVVAGISLATTMLPTVVGLAIAAVLGVVGLGVGVWSLRRYRAAATCGARWSSRRRRSSAGCGAGPRRRSSCGWRAGSAMRC